MVNVSLRRRALLAAGSGLALQLAGCASVEPGPVTPSPADPSRILTPWLSIGGGWRTTAPGIVTGLQPAAGRINFIQPTGVAARNDIVIVADAGLRALLRLERTRDAISVLAPFSGGVGEHGTSIAVGNDYTAWVAHPGEHMVVQYDLRGRVVRRFINEADAPRPVAVVVPESRVEVLVGDAATARVLAFDPLGTLRERLGRRDPGPLQSLTAMALGPLGLYVLDRASQVVVVLDRAGRPIDMIGEHQLVQPRALAVDATGRVFVSDDADQRIKVFRGAEMIASIGGPGAAPGRFGRIESLALDGNLLYVADSLNARIQVLMVAPASMEATGAPR
jgi:DNA-binding beta-propeller fold protein YncE